MSETMWSVRGSHPNRTRSVIGGIALGVLAVLLAMAAAFAVLVVVMPDAWVNVHLDDPPPQHRRMAVWSAIAGIAGTLGALLSGRFSAPLAFGYLLGFLGGVLIAEWLIFSFGQVFSSAPRDFIPDPWLYLPVLAAFAMGHLALAVGRRLARPSPNGPPSGRAREFSFMSPVLVLAAFMAPLWWWFGSPPGAAEASQLLTRGAASIGTSGEPSALWSGSVRCRWPLDSGDWPSLSGFDYPLPRQSAERIVGVRVGAYVELRTTALPPNLTSISDWRDFEEVAPDGSSGIVVIRDVRPDLVIAWACAPIGNADAALTLPVPSSDSESAGSPSETTQHLTIREGAVEVEPRSIPVGSVDVTASSDLRSLDGLAIYLMLLGPLTSDHLQRLDNGDIDWRGGYFAADAKGEPGMVGMSWDLEIDNLQSVGGVTLEPGTYAWIVLDPLLFGTFEVS